jgi:hypothetical protein
MALRWHAPFAMLAHSVADTGWLLKKAALACLLPWLQFACRNGDGSTDAMGQVPSGTQLMRQNVLTSAAMMMLEGLRPPSAPTCAPV